MLLTVVLGPRGDDRLILGLMADSTAADGCWEHSRVWLGGETGQHFQIKRLEVLAH